MSSFEPLEPAPLPEAAQRLLDLAAAPPRLVAHLRLVHDVAVVLLDGVLGRWPGLPVDREAVLFGGRPPTTWGRPWCPQSFRARGGSMRRWVGGGWRSRGLLRRWLALRRPTGRRGTKERTSRICSSHSRMRSGRVRGWIGSRLGWWRLCRGRAGRRGGGVWGARQPVGEDCCGGAFAA